MFLEFNNAILIRQNTNFYEDNHKEENFVMIHIMFYANKVLFFFVLLFANVL